MTNYGRMIFLSAVLAAFLLPATAQTSSAPSGTPPAQSLPNANQINQQKTQQQDRIANGLGNGSLTTNEADSLEKQEGQINQQERQMKAANGGKLSAADKAQLQQEQKGLSNQIYQDKHNAATRQTDPKSGIGKTEQNQQERIAQGMKSGQLTAGESTKLENEESNINKERHQDIQANGGKLTQAERNQIKQQQKQVSKQIYKDKHNGAKR